MPKRTARIEVYMRVGSVGVSTRGAIVRVDDVHTIQPNVMTRLTGGSVVELEPGATYSYEFNVAGDGKFTLAARADGGEIDLGTRAFDSGDAKGGAHSDRTFVFSVPQIR